MRGEVLLVFFWLIISLSFLKCHGLFGQQTGNICLYQIIEISLQNRKHLLAYIMKHFMDCIQVRNRERDIDFNWIQAAEICHATAAEIFLFGCIVFSYITVFFFLTGDESSHLQALRKEVLDRKSVFDSK